MFVLINKMKTKEDHIMPNIEKRRKTAEKVAGTAFFKADLFAACYADEITMDVPSAPPGMPNHFDTWDTERCFEWLNRTVRRWDSEVKEFYGKIPILFTPSKNFSSYTSLLLGGKTYGNNNDMTI